LIKNTLLSTNQLPKELNKLSKWKKNGGRTMGSRIMTRDESEDGS
jgi:hypothetical protein